MNRIPPRLQGDLPEQGQYEDGTPHQHPDDCRYCAAGEGMIHNYEPPIDE